MSVTEVTFWSKDSFPRAESTRSIWRFEMYVIGSLVISLCLFVTNFSTEAAIALLAIAVAVLIVAKPFVGMPVLFLLGMLGDLQHFTGGMSIVKGVTLLVAVGAFGYHSRQPISHRTMGVAFPLIFFIAVYCTGNLLKPSETYDWSVIATWVGYPVGFILVLYLVNTKRRIEWVLGALIAGAILAALASVIEPLFGINTLASLRGIDETVASNGAPGMDRISGLFQEANAAAYMHILAIPLLISLFFLSKNRFVRSAVFVLSIISVSSLLISFSRSGYIGAVAALLCLLFFLNFRKAMYVILLTSVLVVSVSSFVPATAVFARFYAIQDEMGGVSDRSLYYPTAISLIYHHLLIPAGEDAFRAAISLKTGFPYGPHSNILSAGVNGGIVGLVAFLWLIYRYCRCVHSGLKSMRSHHLRYYALGTYAGVIGFQVQGLFMTNFGWFLIWAVAAIPMCCILADGDLALKDSVSSGGVRA